jgi:hypothetical protein
LLAVAIATLWCHELGEFVPQQGEVVQRAIDPAPSRELSLFQLGLRWLQRCLAVIWDSTPTYHARLSEISVPSIVTTRR